MCELLVGLGEVEVLGVDDETGEPLRVHVRSEARRPCCGGCGVLLWSKGSRAAELVDLPAFGRPVRLVWHKRRWVCSTSGCSAGSVTEQNVWIAPRRALLTTRAGRWATRQAGRGRAVGDVALELGCDWHTVNASVRRWGQALLDADSARISEVNALGLDETLFVRRGRWHTKAWCASIVDVGSGQLLDIVPGRGAKAPTKWLLSRPQRWLDGVDWAVLDLSGPYRAAFDAAVPAAGQVADPFHVVQLANRALDEVRRRARNQTLGRRGHKHDPLYGARKLLLAAHERVSESGETKLLGLLQAGDPHSEVRNAWHAKETVRGLYNTPDPKAGPQTVNQLADELQDPYLPPEINRLGRTLWRWRTQIGNWHHSQATNAATEAINNLIKRVKRVGLG
ncbi:MAG: ISL3 family transposase [Acidimicrobiaceae bacterium]|nr:ISL3 family transposase [Acidimicrobiaceae bacterium]